MISFPHCNAFNRCPQLEAGSDLISAAKLGPARKRGHVGSRGRVPVATYPNPDRHRDRLPYYALVRALSCTSPLPYYPPSFHCVLPLLSPPSPRGPVFSTCDGWFAHGMACARNPYSKSRYDQGIDAKIVIMGNTGNSTAPSRCIRSLSAGISRRTLRSRCWQDQPVA